jgi:predicted RNase H-like HicB family nuclease
MENIKLPIVIKNDDNNTFLAYCPVFRGCHTFAENKEDLKDYLEETISMYFDLYKS